MSKVRISRWALLSMAMLLLIGSHWRSGYLYMTGGREAVGVLASNGMLQIEWCRNARPASLSCADTLMEKRLSGMLAGYAMAQPEGRFAPSTERIELRRTTSHSEAAITGLAAGIGAAAGPMTSQYVQMPLWMGTMAAALPLIVGRKRSHPAKAQGFSVV